MNGEETKRHYIPKVAVRLVREGGIITAETLRHVKRIFPFDQTACRGWQTIRYPYFRPYYLFG